MVNIQVIAIAKNERKIVTEWLAHYLVLGFDEIVVYDNESDDGTSEILQYAAESYPILRIPWSVTSEQSPQRSAYDHALKNSLSDWVAFFDLDELLVLSPKFNNVSEFLLALPIDTGAVGINWLTFGSSGILRKDYALTRDAFRRGGPRNWNNNRHIKTIARRNCVTSMGIHDCILKAGRYVSSSGVELVMPKKRGIIDRVDHAGAQLNHYQVRSRQEYDEKIAKGRSGKKMNDPTRVRDNPEAFLEKLDRNDFEYDEIDRYSESFSIMHSELLRVVDAAVTRR